MSGGTSDGGGYSPVSAAKHMAASCHWSVSGVGAHRLPTHSLGMGAKRASGTRSAGISVSGTAHCQPSNQILPMGAIHTLSEDTLPCTEPESCR